MPELPDLEAMRAFFNTRLPGRTIQRAQVRIPVVVRASREEFAQTLAGNTFQPIWRRGKFLVFPLRSGQALVVNLMLTGRFRYDPPAAKMPAKTCFVIALEDGREVRYVDERLMGKAYLVAAGELARVPQWAEMGPDALDPALTAEAFRGRLRRYRGQIKNVLLKQEFVAGIGNAYADEILFVAGLHPYRQRTALAPEDEERLYQAMHDVLEEAIAIVGERTREELPQDEIRDFLKVHRRGGQPCPRCGAAITEVTANQRVTSFCRHCQK